ncbi:MAG TPA: dienelactone hydrolase family protein, partial [Bordetella sp.]
MRGWLMGLVLIGFFGSWAWPAGAQERVRFPSLDAQATPLDGYLYAAPGQGRHPALVFMHGCGGLLTKSGKVVSRERQWAQRFNDLGVTVLMVDSMTPRQHGEMCAPAHFDASIYRARPFDAYGALHFLRSRDDIRADRVGLVGWSAGGGAVLNAIRASSPARRAAGQGESFRAAVAFYPASCSRKRQGGDWSSPVPLLVLLGGKDVWIPLDDCKDLLGHASPAAQLAWHVYDDAYHDFDWPGLRTHEAPAFRTRAGVVPI